MSIKRTSIFANPKIQWMVALTGIFLIWTIENSISTKLLSQLTPSEIPASTKTTASTEILKEMQALLITPGTPEAPVISPQPASTDASVAQVDVPTSAPSPAAPDTPVAPTPPQPPAFESIKKIAAIDALFPDSRAAIINREYRHVGDILDNLTYGTKEAPGHARLIAVTPTYVIVEDTQTHEKIRLD